MSESPLELGVAMLKTIASIAKSRQLIVPLSEEVVATILHSPKAVIVAPDSLIKLPTVALKLLSTSIVPLLLKLAAVILALPETVSVSFALQIKLLADSEKVKSPPTLRLKTLVVIVPLA